MGWDELGRMLSSSPKISPVSLRFWHPTEPLFVIQYDMIQNNSLRFHFDKIVSKSQAFIVFRCGEVNQISLWVNSGLVLYISALNTRVKMHITNHVSFYFLFNSSSRLIYDANVSYMYQLSSLFAVLSGWRDDDTISCTYYYFILYFQLIIIILKGF